MKPPSELVAVGFEGTQRASEVLNEVQSLSDSRTFSVRDGVAVYRTENGTLHIDQSVHPTSREAAGWGGRLGGLLGALLAAPLTAAASVAAAAGAVGAGALTVGVPGAVTGRVQPGQSAMFVVVEAGDPEKTAEHFRGYGGTVLRTTLSPGKAGKLQELLTAR